ncbi:MAG: MFS transporter [Clostridia bacterium]|nr:MFS transporter [Clostridia bacterium]
MKSQSVLSRRRLYLFSGVLVMLFSGVLYAWSILKIPFAEEYQWEAGFLALNFTLTMCFFCLGAFFGSLLNKKIGIRYTLLISAFLSGGGFVLTGFIPAEFPFLLIISYAFLSGTGIGISYNVVVSSVTSWFPDKKGISSGCLMLGFGLSTLILGNVIDFLYKSESVGWNKAFILLGAVLFTVLIFAAFTLKMPDADIQLPVSGNKRIIQKEAFERRDFTTSEMLRNFTFWRAFICMTLLTAVGNSAISFARDLVLSVDASPDIATTMVGVLAVCNGFGRILTGILFDRAGRRFAMYSANIITIIAAGVTLMAVNMNSLPICIIGLCLTGISYGSCPTVTSAFTSAFYGQKHFSVNYSLINFNLIFASFIAGFSNTLMINTGSYSSPFIMLLILAFVAMGLNISIKRP